MNVPRVNGNKFYPVANQWANEEFKIEGFEVVVDPKPGDVIAFKNSSGMGHVGIVSGDEIYISAGGDKVEEKRYYDLGYYNGKYEKIVFRRYIKK